MQNRDFVITGLQAWDLGIGSNCKNIALELSKNNRVLYVNPPADRLSSLRSKGPKKANRHLSQINENLWVLSPQHVIESVSRLPFAPLFDIINKHNNKVLAKEIKAAMEQLGFKNHIHFCDSDMFRSYYLKELLKPEFYIYYTRDNLLAVKYWQTQGLRIEPRHMAKADAVAANSSYLAKLASRHNKNSHFVGQGCDLSAFQKANTNAIPSDMGTIPKPIIGYIGALKALRLDLDVLETIASERSDWSIVLVGPEDDVFKESKLHTLPNVYFLGRKDEDQLPAYLAAFDVAINPQVFNEVTIGNYPRKIDEYLAMGKPTVATQTEAMDYFKEYVSLAKEKADWIPLIEQALANNTPQREAARQAFASEHTWEKNVSEIYQLIGPPKAHTAAASGGLKNRILRSERLKHIATWMLMPSGQARPRRWVKWFINPLLRKRGKGSTIRNRTRMDILPFNRFELGERSTIEDFCTVNNGVGNVIIGSRTRIGIGSVLIGPVAIGNDVRLAQHVVISALNHNYTDINLPISEQGVTTAQVAVEDESWIGSNAVILPGVTIGKHCVVAAGSVVTKSIPPYCVAGGNPARIIRQYNAATNTWEKVENTKSKP